VIREKERERERNRRKKKNVAVTMINMIVTKTSIEITSAPDVSAKFPG